MAASSAWGRRSASPPASSPPVAPSAPSSSPATNTSSAARARFVPELLRQQRPLGDLAQFAETRLHHGGGLGSEILQLLVAAVEPIVDLGLQRLLMAVHLHLEIVPVEIRAGRGLERIELLLMLAVERRRHGDI